MADDRRMRWDRLLSARRPVRDGKTGAVSVREDAFAPGVAGGRSPFQVDVDRLIFSSAFRRLQNKTQVHPLSDNDHVRTRLTHTIEVASVGQSLGLTAGKTICDRLGARATLTPADIGYVVQAGCLAHDIGNPPFGHSGEEAIRDWFRRGERTGAVLPAGLSEREWNDLRHFEGNAQGFRIVTQLEMMRHEGGLRLTCATLGAFSKYPRGTDPAMCGDSYAGARKPGYYVAEAALFRAMAGECGLLSRGADAWCRHPLVYLVEAADDICYSVVDMEDGWELGCVGFAEVEEALAPIARHPRKYPGGPAARTAALRAEGWYAEKMESEKLGFLRGKAIGNLIADVAETFVRCEDALLGGAMDEDLIGCSSLGMLAKNCKKLALARIYHADHVLPTEIAGFEVLHGLLDRFVGAAVELHEAGGAARDMPAQSQRILKLLGRKLEGADSLYEKLMRVMDYIGGMTDRYAVGLYRKLQGIT